VNFLLLCHEGAVLEKINYILAKSIDITFYVIFIIIFYAFVTGMPIRYEWKNHSECFSLWKYPFLDLGHNYRKQTI
jgi:hypothetical protein